MNGLVLCAEHVQEANVSAQVFSGDGALSRAQHQPPGHRVEEPPAHAASLPSCLLSEQNPSSSPSFQQDSQSSLALSKYASRTAESFSLLACVLSAEQQSTWQSMQDVIVEPLTYERQQRQSLAGG